MPCGVAGAGDCWWAKSTSTALQNGLMRANQASTPAGTTNAAAPEWDSGARAGRTRAPMQIARYPDPARYRSFIMRPPGANECTALLAGEPATRMPLVQDANRAAQQLEVCRTTTHSNPRRDERFDSCSLRRFRTKLGRPHDHGYQCAAHPRRRRDGACDPCRLQ